jgi:hypothetical protein
MITQAFKIGDRVRPSAGPYRRTEFAVVGVEGDRISVEAGKLKLAFPSKLLKPAPKGTAIVRYEVPVEGGKPLLTRELQSTIGFFEHAKNPELESDSGGARADNLPVLSEADLLRAEIAAIKAEGTLAPDNCWVDWKPQSGGFKQVVWRSRTAIFTAIRGGGLVKSSYIGKEGSPEHSFALSAIARRNQVQKLEKRLRKLEKNANN